MTLAADEPEPTVRLDKERLRRQQEERELKTSLCPCLVVIAGPDLGRRHVLERTVVVGRSHRCGLQLSDKLVSSRHARIEDRGDGWALVDEGSTNGTLVNDLECSERVLVANDKIRLGDTVLRFELQDERDRAFDQELERLINIDDLSGLWVRRTFDRELAAMVAAAEVAQRPVALLVMDLDGVKGINDTHGHLFGAHVIAEAGKLIGRVLGDRGIAARFGGDEYVAAAPGLDVDGAAELAESIRRAIAEHRFEREGVRLRPGISIGIAAFPESAADPEALFRCADGALYRAKAAGKNCVRR